MIIIDRLNYYLKRKGAILVGFPNSELKRRKAILNQFKINKVLDVGANVGQYAKDIRELNFEGDIISFEPIKHVFNLLEKNQKNDYHSKCENYALGDFDGETQINIAGNSAVSSSILEMLPAHLESAPNSKYIKTEKITVKKLDSIFNLFCTVKDNVYLKIDAQGFEKNILEGGEYSLNKIKVLQIELSLMPLYKDSINYLDMIDFLNSKGFELYGLEPGFSNQITGQLLQFDGIFVNKNL